MFSHEYDEWRAEVRAMSETERFVACGHTVRNYGVCVDCGDRGGDDD